MTHVTRTAVTGSSIAIALLLAACNGDVSVSESGGSETGATEPAIALSGEPAASDTTEPAVDETDVPEEPAVTAMPDPCSLLTPAQIESATGMSVGDGLAEADRQTSFSSLCEWTQTGGDKFVAVAIAPDYPIPYEDGVDDAKAISVAGASEAYTVRTGVTMGMLVDGDYVSVTFNGPFDGEQGGGAIAIAEVVAANLG